LIKETKGKKFIEKFEKETPEGSSAESNPNTNSPYSISYSIFNRICAEDAEGLSSFLKQLYLLKGKKEAHI
jgi:hypothetical protein